ncbi:MAG: O-antigen ligase family protein, partial [Clostridia bacterium]|nr:O-antigen ligase family protein [Clostridia bacterium]
IILFGPCVVSKNEIPSQMAYLTVLLVPLAAAAIYHILKYRRGGQSNGFGKRSNLAPLIALTFAFLLGGLFSPAPQRKLIGLALTLYLGVLPLAIYLVVKSGYDNKAKDVRRYVAKVMVAWGVLVTVQACIRYLTDLVNGVDLMQNLYVPDLGWGVSNLFCTVLTVCIPFNFYFLNKHFKWIAPMLALTAVQFIIIVFSHSRGALLFAALNIFLSVAVSLYRYRKFKIVWLFFSVCALAAVLIASRYSDTIFALLGKTFEDKLDSNGRDLLYLEALDKFMENPMFGAGLGYIGYKNMRSLIYLFHSTVFQTIGSLGLAGVCAMIFVYIMRYYTVLRKRDAFNVTMFVALIGFEGYSVIDTGTYNAIPFLVMLAIFMAAAELSNAQLDNAELLRRQFVNDRLSLGREKG